MMLRMGLCSIVWEYVSVNFLKRYGGDKRGSNERADTTWRIYYERHHNASLRIADKEVDHLCKLHDMSLLHPLQGGCPRDYLINYYQYFVFILLGKSICSKFWIVITRWRDQAMSYIINHNKEQSLKYLSTLVSHNLKGPRNKSLGLCSCMWL